MNNYRIVRCIESGRAFTKGEQYAILVGSGNLHLMWEDEDGDLCELSLETQKTESGEVFIPAEGESRPKFESEDVQVVICAEWIDVISELGVTLGKCSNCVKRYENKKPLDISPLSYHKVTPYCPICGATMKGEKR